MTAEKFNKKINEFKEEQNKQKMRGLNDYNMVNIVRGENQEVGMHSNVIYSLLDSNGLHYQGDLFLKLFITEVLKIKDFGENIAVVKEDTTPENRRIDFTIESDKYSIGIEMKINASDLKCQISDYRKALIDKLKKNTKNTIAEENVIIYYLTKFGTDAKEYSHKGTKYSKISFENDILNWITNCQKEIKNINNLNEAFENYKNIVKKIINKYESNIKPLYKYLLENKELFKYSQDFYEDYHKNENNYSDLSLIKKDTLVGYEDARKKITEDFFEVKLIEYLKEEFKEELDNSFEINSEFNSRDNKYKITIKNGDKEIILGSSGYSTIKDYYSINNKKEFSKYKYRYRYSKDSVCDFYNDDLKVKEYYLELINKNIKNEQ